MKGGDIHGRRINTHGKNHPKAKPQSREDRIANLVKRGFVSEELVDMADPGTDKQKKAANAALYARIAELRKAGRQFDLVVSDDGKRELFVMPEVSTTQK